MGPGLPRDDQRRDCDNASIHDARRDDVNS
jgi:hypothetical protein